MEYRPLGRTGLTVSVLGYGASPLGGVYGRVDVAEAISSVHAALDLGVASRPAQRRPPGIRGPRPSATWPAR